MSLANSQIFTNDARKDDAVSSKVRSLQQVIRLTQENLEELDRHFKGVRHPPSMFLEEYEGLQTKLSQLQFKKKELLESGTPSSNDNHSLVTEPESTLTCTTPTSSSSRASSTTCDVPGSPVTHDYVRVYLPNKQRTAIKYKPGTTIEKALSKGMLMRGLSTDMCYVVRISKQGSVREELSWSTDLSNLNEGDEISVEKRGNIPISSSISHNFIRKTFFTLAFCDSCRKLLFQGFRCQICGYRFHQRCALNVPSICLAVQTEKVYEFLVNINNRDDETNFHENGNTESLISRERSISAPNVHKISLQEGGFKYPKDASATMSGASPLGVEKRMTGLKSVGSPPPVYNVFDDRRDFERRELMDDGRLRPQSRVLPERPMTPNLGANRAHYRFKQRAKSSSEIKEQRQRHNSNDDWEIPEEEVEMGERIGSGSYGTVFKAQWHGTVAVKRLNITEPTPAQLQAFKNEVAVLRKTRHINVLLFMGCISKPSLAIVTQWCEGSTLYRHLHVNESKFEILQLLDIGRQIAQGMDYLHAKSIIHRDLKSNNIFLQEDLTVKIGDFGLATIKSRWSGQNFEQPSGSILWMAPEIIRMKDSHPYSNKSDVYAYGIVLYELTSRTLPYSNIGNKDQILYMVGRGFLRVDLNKIRSDCPKSLKRLLMDCINFHRDERPLFQQILAEMDSLIQSLPKIHRSTSEPVSLNRTRFSSEDGVFMSNGSPDTPIHSPYVGSSFPFFQNMNVNSHY
ncbi:serine/threonine-protein kinase A-Raf-like [Xenia sp. Carnegie-2017]|uniref:serine/threonine-protein kinase A-Raf-like n=1 Tax=Xenia sp. Carnegie-2017 TaxID=2897299 RepID=UPI001F041908|nr:serine/threonine-protein kinase A-Raf-like [Xenia sp. Carnegie-2017]